VLLAHPRLSEAGEALIAAANEAGGRDNITVVLLRLEEVHAAGELQLKEADTGVHAVEDWDGPHATMTAMPAVVAPVTPPVTPRRPRRASEPASARPARHRARLRRTVVAVVLLFVLAVIGSAAYLAQQSVYFIGTNSRGLVTVFRGFPYRLPAGVNLYSSDYVSGVSASTISPERRKNLLDHSWRSEGNAAALIRSLELGQLE